MLCPASKRMILSPVIGCRKSHSHHRRWDLPGGTQAESAISGSDQDDGSQLLPLSSPPPYRQGSVGHPPNQNPIILAQSIEEGTWHNVRAGGVGHCALSRQCGYALRGRHRPGMADAERTGMSNSDPRNVCPRRPLTPLLSIPPRNAPNIQFVINSRQ